MCPPTPGAFTKDRPAKKSVVKLKLLAVWVKLAPGTATEAPPSQETRREFGTKVMEEVPPKFSV